MQPATRARGRTPVYAVKCDIDRDGCEFGRLSRERITWVTAAVDKMDKKLNYVLAAAGLQLFGFLLTVVGVMIYRLH
jgi:hypothetical protein